MRLGGTVWNNLKGGESEKRGRETKNLKGGEGGGGGGGYAGSKGGYLKKGQLESLTNYVCEN